MSTAITQWVKTREDSLAEQYELLTASGTCPEPCQSVRVFRYKDADCPLSNGPILWCYKVEGPFISWGSWDKQPLIKAQEKALDYWKSECRWERERQEILDVFRALGPMCIGELMEVVPSDGRDDLRYFCSHVEHLVANKQLSSGERDDYYTQKRGAQTWGLSADWLAMYDTIYQCTAS